MAVLINKQTQQKCLLQSHHSFGRLEHSVNTCISNAYVSKVHAFIEWNESHWLLRDVSSNGTWVNGTRLMQNHAAILNVGDVISFAAKAGYLYEVQDISPPRDCLVPVKHNSEAIELEYFHLLHNKQSHSIVLSYNNETYSWWQEILDDNLNETQSLSELQDQDYLDIDGLAWQLQINRPSADTQLLRPSVNSFDELTFLFQTSLDEESTHLILKSGEQTIDLFTRNHHYVTLYLARQRVSDSANNLDESEQGWVYTEVLAKDLGVEISHLNIQIYRIRKQLIDALNNANESNNIIERKAGKLRLANLSFCIKKGDTVECDTRQTFNQSISQTVEQKAH